MLYDGTSLVTSLPPEVVGIIYSFADYISINALRQSTSFFRNGFDAAVDYELIKSGVIRLKGHLHWIPLNDRTVKKVWGYWVHELDVEKVSNHLRYVLPPTSLVEDVDAVGQEKILRDVLLFSEGCTSLGCRASSWGRHLFRVVAVTGRWSTKKATNWHVPVTFFGPRGRKSSSL